MEHSHGNMIVVLFDIDGTLIRAVGMGRLALHRAFEEVFGVEAGDTPAVHAVPFNGRTDPVIIADIAAALGIEGDALTAGSAALEAAFLRHLEQTVAESRTKEACPGVPELLATLDAEPSASDLRQAEAAVQQASLALSRAQADLEAATLVAPFGGVVLEIHAHPGQAVAAGTGLISLADSSALEAEVTVIEEDLPLVQVGQEVELFFDAQPDAIVEGTVARLVPKRLPGDRPLYPVYVALDELPEGLFPGMTVDVSIIIGGRSDVLRLPRALVRARSDGTAQVRVWTHDQIEVRTVRVGLRGDVYVEILDGLHEGEQVVGQ